MPTLNEIIAGAAGGTTTVFTTDNIVIEPLDGPTSVEEVMDRFPEEVYQQGHDSHLYRLLQALCGDAGAGLAKKQAYAARLSYEAEFVNFDVLDDVYVAQFRFQRLRSETYPYHVDADALTPTQWDQVLLADQSYYHRVQEWWEAVRYGTSQEAMRLAASAGTGIDCDVAPQYRFIFDLYSDLPLGLKPEGITNSCEEFTVIPRFLPGDDVSYMTDYEQMWTFTPPALNNTLRPVPAPGATVISSTFVAPVTRVDEVGSSARQGNSIPIPAHQVGDLIVVTAMQFGALPTAPTPGGTVPNWATAESNYVYQLGVRTAAFVATATNHTSGTWPNTGYMMVNVFRPTNGTLSVGAHASTALQGPGPFTTFPALTLQNRDANSAVLRILAVRETGDSQIATPPEGYNFLAQYGARAPLLPPVPPEVSAGFASSWRPAVGDLSTATVRTTNSGGPGASIATSLEVKMTPGAPVETREQRQLRYQLEETQDLVKQPFDRILPELERNGLEMLDRLKPTTSVATFRPEDGRFTEVPVGAVAASSERVNVTRLVTGNVDVPWPDVDPEHNFFIVAGQETEPGYFYGSNRDLPVVFLTVESAHAYTGEAVGDATYGTNAFFTPANGIQPFEFYRSEHVGQFFPVISAIFPFVFNVTDSASFTADQAVAVQNTPLILEGPAVA
jgi:hypothetical protein